MFLIVLLNYLVKKMKESNSKFLLLVIVLSFIQNISPVQYLPNPCPEYFKYERDGFHTYGIIEVPPIQLGMNLRLDVELSLKANLQDVSF